MKSSYRTFIFTAVGGFTLPMAAGFGQLKVEEKAPAIGSSAVDENELVPALSEIESPVYIPEPSAYGLLGAAALGAVLLRRRIKPYSATRVR